MKTKNEYALEKLVLPEYPMFMTWNDIEFHYTPNTEDPDNIKFHDTPAVGEIGTSSDGQWTGIDVYTTDGIPEEYQGYLDILVVHEIVERYEAWSGVPEDEAHSIAMTFHLGYAHKFLSAEEFMGFLDWQKQFEHYQ